MSVKEKIEKIHLLSNSLNGIDFGTVISQID